MAKNILPLHFLTVSIFFCYFFFCYPLISFVKQKCILYIFLINICDIYIYSSFVISKVKFPDVQLLGNELTHGETFIKNVSGGSFQIFL